MCLFIYENNTQHHVRFSGGQFKCPTCIYVCESNSAQTTIYIFELQFGRYNHDNRHNSFTISTRSGSNIFTLFQCYRVGVIYSRGENEIGKDRIYKTHDTEVVRHGGECILISADIVCIKCRLLRVCRQSGEPVPFHGTSIRKTNQYLFGISPLPLSMRKYSIL